MTPRPYYRMERGFRGMAHHGGRLACGLMLSISVGTTAVEAGATAGVTEQWDSPGEVLKDTLHISAGGPYVAKAGLPITLHGTYFVTGQTENSDRLKTIGQAIQSYVRVHGTYPPAALMNASGRRTLSWRVLLLPYLGEKRLYDRFDLAKPWDDPVNLYLLTEMPAVYRKSGGNEESTETGFAGVDGVNSLFQTASAELNGGRPTSGISATQAIAVGPVGSDVHLPWTAPGDINIKRATQLGSPHGFSGEGNAFTPLLFLDGSVHLVPDNVGTASMIAWTDLGPMMSPMTSPMWKPAKPVMGCLCAPPNSVDAGIQPVWDLGSHGTVNTQGFDAKFLASKPGNYTVKMQVFDHFGNRYESSTKVEVH